jgi:hypothetical protein
MGEKEPTQFLQQSGVDARGHFAGISWFTLGAWEGGEARRQADSLVASGKFMLVDEEQWSHRAKGDPTITGLRILSLKQLLELGPEETHQALVGLCNWWDEIFELSTYLGLEIPE